MRRNLIISWLLICIFLGLTSSTIRNLNVKASANVLFKFDLPRFSQNANRCNLSVDPKLELLEIIQYLADDPTITKNRFNDPRNNYCKEIENSFNPFKQEEIVLLYKEMRNKKFSYGRIPGITIRTDDYFRLKNNLPDIQDYINGTGNSRETIEKFLMLLPEFCLKTNFEKFYMDHEIFYTSLITDIKDKILKIGAIDKVVNYYGYEHKSYNLIIYPLANGSFADRLPSTDGRFDVYNFTTTPSDLKQFSELLIHEYGHSYLRKLTYEKYKNEIQHNNKLYTPIEASMKQQAYGTWINCADEHIVRAITYRIIGQIFGLDVSNTFIQRDIKNNFKYLNPIYLVLENYEKTRLSYPTINEFYPEIVKVFNELSVGN